MNLILTHILAQVQFNKNMIHYHTKWKGNLSFCSGYIQHHPNKKNYKKPKKKNMHGGINTRSAGGASLPESALLPFTLYQANRGR
jgi:hypothetical protein